MVLDLLILLTLFNIPFSWYKVMQVLRFASIYKTAVFENGISSNFKILRLASIYKEAATHASLHRWAAGIVTKAFQQVMGRAPTPAERQIVMAVSDLESNYGKGWGGKMNSHWLTGKSSGGRGSHNWGAIQTRSKENSFRHQDSSIQGKYVTNFKIYPDDIAGAADVIKNLFKANGKQRIPDPKNSNRAIGPSVNGPGRAELIQAAAQTGDIDAFSRAMWFTNYFEGTAPNYEDRIRAHAKRIQQSIDSITSALGEPSAWSHQSPNVFSPVTNNGNQIVNVNTPIAQKPQSQQLFNNVYHNNKQQDYGSALESLLWQ
jgi:hypothetical protein